MSAPQNTRPNILLKMVKNVYPLSYIDQFAILLSELGVPIKTLLEGSEISVTDLENPDRTIDEDVFLQIFRKGRALAETPDLAVRWGLRQQPTFHGPLGLAAISSICIRDALDVICKYIPICIPKLEMRYEINDDQTNLIINSGWPDYSDREFELIAVMASFQKMVEVFLSAHAKPSIQLSIKKPTWWTASPLSHRSWSFDAVESKISFPTKSLEQRFSLADKGTHLQMRQMCEKSLSERLQSDSTGDKIRKILLQAGPYRKISHEQAASKIGMTKSSLYKALAAERTSFRLIREEVLAAVAARLVQEEPKTPLYEISQRLGYHDLSNFNRAFRRWHNTSPAAFRRGAQENFLKSTQNRHEE